MKNLSLQPDEDMKWIYDYTHPEYNTDRARHLREARARALASAPEWMIEGARLNDILKRKCVK
jgi:hypothetical protein